MSLPAAHAYRSELATHVEERWRSPSPGVARPLLEQLLSAMFPASLLRDEERPVTLRLLCVDPRELLPGLASARGRQTGRVA